MYSLRNYENIYLSVSYDFSKFKGLGKSKCDVPSGTTQGCFCPFSTPSLCCSRVCLLGFAHQWIGILEHDPCMVMNDG